MLIFHGENIVASRQKLIDKLKRFQGETIRLEGEKINLTQLKQALETQSLFGQEKLVVVENLFSRPTSKAKENFLHYIKENKPPNLVVWERKTIDGRVLVSFKFAQIEKFVVPAIIFKFLDSLSPQNKKNSLFLMHQCLKKDAPEMVFYMLSRQIRNLIIAADLGEKGLERMAPWQKGKFIRQAKNFSLQQLLNFYKKLSEIDWQQKTGRATIPLASQLDLLLASL